MIVFTISSKLALLVPFKPSLISSTVNTPSPFLSNYLNNFPKSVISFSDSWLAIKVKATFLSLWCYVKFLRALKFNGGALVLLLISSFIQGWAKTSAGVALLSGEQIIYLIRSLADSVTFLNSSTIYLNN